MAAGVNRTITSGRVLIAASQQQVAGSLDSRSVNYTAFKVGRPNSATDKRRAPRQDVRWKGLVHDEKGTAIATCIMTNVSAGGAKLDLEAGTDVPDCFVLTLARNAAVRRTCEVVWRAATSVGVCFVTSI